MNETIKVKIDGKEYEYFKGITLAEVSKPFADTKKYPIILAKVNKKLKELDYKLNSNCVVEFLDLTSSEGNRVHINGLTYIIIYAVKQLYGRNADIIVKHSIDKGVYIETNFRIDPQKLETISNEMKKIVDNDLEITRLMIDRMEATKYFRTVNDNPKADILKYNTNDYIALYRLGNMYNYFYSLMPPSTGALGQFKLTFVGEKAFVLSFPTPYIPDRIKEYEHHAHMFDVFREYQGWAEIMNITTAVELNKFVSRGNIDDLIRMDETLQSYKLLNIAREISQNKDIKIILMAGPSSSGKTTTSKKLTIYLRSLGIKIRPISMDDYFLDKGDTPLGKDGKPDYECLEAVDLKLFDEQIEALLNGKEVTTPIYNFIVGTKEFSNKMKLEDNEIILVEGIHGLNTNILTNIDRRNKYKIYLSPLTALNIDNHNRVSTSDDRLLRRIIRDNRTRGYGVEKSLEAWKAVRRGEEEYIFPYQDDADATFNTALIYELGALKTYVEPLLYSVNEESDYYEEAKRLIKFLKIFLPIPSDAIPKESILREFIGNGCFHL